MRFTLLSTIFLIFFLGRTTTDPVKYKKPIKAEDYKYFVSLEEQKKQQEKTVGQKIKEVFVKPKPIEVQTNVVTSKNLLKPSKRKSFSPPKRRVRTLNTNVTNSTVTTEPEKTEELEVIVSEETNSLVNNLVVYFISFQAFMIVLLGFLVIKDYFLKKKPKAEKRELNL